ncbi:aminotransferase class III-fold pyridoxal phosphate-dependent enzyme [Dasania marina]|uniref:aminotransferase class III-fold pyridoxal phosphate-dependent enzyme n=1 Tax=Dasania marina TaxID=471499 RepID=UPI0030DAD471
MLEVAQLLDRNVPAFSLEDIKRIALQHFKVQGEFKRLPSERDQSYRLTADNGTQYIFKVSNAQDAPADIDFQTQALLHIAQQNDALPVPRILPTVNAEPCAIVAGQGDDQHVVRLLSFLPGIMIGERAELNTTVLRRNVGATVARLGHALRGFFHPNARNSHPWDMMNFMVYREHTHHITNPEIRSLVEAVFDRANSLMPKLTALRHQVVHQDAHSGNLLINPEQPDHVAGIIDFGDMLYGPLMMELVVACDLMMHRVADPVGDMCDIVAGFDSEFELEEQELDLLYDMIMVRNAITLAVSAWRAAMSPDEPPYVDDIDLYETLITRLHTIGRAEITARFRKACCFPVYSPAIGEYQEPNPQAETQLKTKRKELLGDPWHFYQQPLHFERARGPWLYEVNGKAYLDLYNNVPQVGHCHPHVARAIGRQAKVLNTNTRYMYQSVLDYAERLVALTPDHIDACIFVNSGSEANDLAVQISRVITGERGAIIVEDAYHGVTDATMDLSPCEGRRPDYVAYLGVPCPYRGPHAGKPDMAELYAQDADKAIAQLDQRGFKPSYFMVDTAYCSSGVVDVPEGYLAKVEAKVRAAGGLIIADEVQAGFGRLGQMWGHEAHGMKADMITMGKPVGNGHPLGVLMLNKKVLAQFMQTTELFSTFGGNAVSCAAGMAVLDVIENENLIANANSTGDYLRAQLRKLAETQPLIGDVRGRGMLASVEFVTDRISKAPATEQTGQLLELMREQQVLIGSSGPLKNSLKLRPSLVFQPEHVDIFIAALDNCLSQLSATN